MFKVELILFILPNKMFEVDLRSNYSDLGGIQLDTQWSPIEVTSLRE